MGNSIRIPEVNISVELSKDKAQALKDYQENGVTYQDSHPWLPTNFIRPSALNLFCTQSSHGIIRPNQGRWNLSATAKKRFLGTTESTCLLVHMPPSPQLPRYHTSVIPHVLKSTSLSQHVPESTYISQSPHLPLVHTSATPQVNIFSESTLPCVHTSLSPHHP